MNAAGARRSARVAVAGTSRTTRVAAVGALACVVALVALLILSSGSTYTLRADFQDASGLVSGNDVLIGPAQVGSVDSVGLTPDGAADVVMHLDSSAGPMHEGTVARIYQNSLSGIANKYVVLEPGPSSAPAIPDGGAIGEDHTYSDVSLDQLFDAFDPLTRAGLRGVIRGEAASLQGRGLDANRTLEYLAPGLASTSEVTAELTREQPAFDRLIVQGAQALQALASRGTELSARIDNTNATAAAIAQQSQALQQALTLLPGTLNRSSSTFAGLDTTLDALDPVVAAAKPGAKNLAAFAANLRSLISVAIPTIGELNLLIHNPAGTGDLISLLNEAPSLASVAAGAFPRLLEALNDSQPQLDYLREYTPDVVAALTNLGQASAYYDANGHYVRTQPYFNAFALNGFNQLETRFPSARYEGLQVVHGRCPGGAVQPSPDRSAPWAVPGCNPAATPPGP